MRHLSLADFRSWSRLDLALPSGPVVFVGRNGAGKTNIVEAVGFLATLGSHRVSTDAPLIRRTGQESASAARIGAVVVSQGRELTVEVEITAGKANRARINKSPQRRARDILGIVRTVLFAPEDLALVRGDPSDRRRFLDEMLMMRAPRLAGVRADYDKILRQRSTLLKSAGSARRSGSALGTLDVWDEQLAATGAELLAARLGLVDELRPLVVDSYGRIASSDVLCDIAYQTTLFDDAIGAVLDSTVRDVPTLADGLLSALRQVRERELDRGVCLVGPHRDDLRLDLHGGPAKGFASHGESWSFALALRLASYELLRSDGAEPILILDDVFAELDVDRRNTLASIAAQAEQSLITAAVGGDIPEQFDATRIAIGDDPEGGSRAIPDSAGAERP